MYEREVLARHDGRTGAKVACLLALLLALLLLPGKALADTVITGDADDAAVAAGEALAAESSAPLDVEGVAATAIAESSVDGEPGVLAPYGRTVYVSRTGTKYHFSATCSGMRSPISMSLEEAQASGRTACATCASGSGSDDPGSGGTVTPEPPSDPVVPDAPAVPSVPVTDVASSTLSRLSGGIALDTMRAITTRGFNDGSCQTVVLATMGGYWDALTASGLAGLTQSPVLLTDGQALSVQTAAEIQRLGAERVLVAGGPAAVSDQVLNQVRATGNVKQVQRFAGATATGTAVKIFQDSTGWGDVAIVATSNSFHDALSIAPYAYACKAPIFLSEPNGGVLSNETLKAIVSGGFAKVVIVGGPAAVPDTVENQLGSLYAGRLYGSTAFETSNEIAAWCVSQGMQANYLGVATGNDYYDALAGAALCGKNNAALVLVSDENRATVNGFVASHSSSISTAYVFGGPAAVSPTTFNAVAGLLP